MLRPSKDLQDLAIGDVKDLYFDDKAWANRYLVVDTDSCLSSREVLISPIAAGKPDWLAKRLPVSLSREQARNSRGIDTRCRSRGNMKPTIYPATRLLLKQRAGGYLGSYHFFS